MTGHIYPLHQQFTLLFVHRVCQTADLKKLIYLLPKCTNSAFDCSHL